jgi:DNA-binding NtrC family response regulator
MATLLFVDDEELIGMVVSRFFAMRGDVVHLAKTVAEARAVLEREDPAIIFLDVWLGTERGTDVLLWIQEHRPQLVERVTFVTGEHPGPHGSAPAWTRFGRPVIRKPFDLTALAEALDAAESRAGT